MGGSLTKYWLLFLHPVEFRSKIIRISELNRLSPTLKSELDWLSSTLNSDLDCPNTTK